MTKPAAAPPRRKTRSDAARNRERLLDAAKALIAVRGADARLEAVARQAGLGIGTLYRHFPTREELYEAVYRRDIDQLVLLGEEAMSASDPVEGLRSWLHAAIDMVATKKGMIAAFALSTDTTSAISKRLSGRLIDAIDPLLARAVEAGRLRDEVAGEDLLLAVVGMCMMRDQPGWRASVLRLIDSLVSGLEVEG
ncbi:TetR/AcrR family transcriptional regulator [Marinivivus vitaminiproducens]|uniref:TetR/AcrR family transcriptional regulator n=1 Tax=Marinivivus vitaminiproducens TaxID=3035935 RepID=UPI0027A6C7B6|nr:helix-turn-helix domain containing protein [Geminicoccaceae bacterium SCSIO 64248]